MRRHLWPANPAGSIIDRLTPAAPSPLQAAHVPLKLNGGVPDLEERRYEVDVCVLYAELVALAQATPPMTGAEYLGPEILEGLWGPTWPRNGFGPIAPGGSQDGRRSGRLATRA